MTLITTFVSLFLFLTGGYVLFPLLLMLAINVVFATIDVIKTKKIKPRFKNSLFVIPVLVTLANFALILIGYFLEEYFDTSFTWAIAEMIAIVTPLILVASLLSRLAFICIKKINGSEFLIWFFINALATVCCIFVIFARI